MENKPETEKALRAKKLWKGSATVFVASVSGAESFSPDTPAEEKERIIQSWNTIAILKVDSIASFRIGFIRNDEVWILDFPIQTPDGKFGMRIGKDDLRFFALDVSGKAPIELSLVEIIQEGDSRYSQLTIY